MRQHRATAARCKQLGIVAWRESHGSNLNYVEQCLPGVLHGKCIHTGLNITAGTMVAGLVCLPRRCGAFDLRREESQSRQEWILPNHCCDPLAP